MTKQDLRIIYKQETGKDAIEDVAFEFDHTLDRVDAAEIQSYVDWLVDRVITLQNIGS